MDSSYFFQLQELFAGPGEQYFLRATLIDPALSSENINSLQNWDCWKQIGRKFYQIDCIRPCIALIKNELLNFETIARGQ